MDGVESKKKDSTNTPGTKDHSTSSGGNVPSGFILKLYQMVNGAPDEVITWTSSGDAFIIGSDLNRLESETLPQYFRHNRFQSLVRQLNFYSFRKINRERNVWIYKHNLFHRDHPEELYQVRRRTCPGVDGRKQRFSRLSAHKLNKSDNEGGGDSTSEDDSVEEEQQLGNDPEIYNIVQSFSSSKRNNEVLDNTNTSTSIRSSKKARILPVSDQTITNDFEVDTSVMSNPIPSPKIVRDSIFEIDYLADDGSARETNDRTEMIHSLVVSEVAIKLEAYVKRAMKERGLTRTRRGGSGIVTPPFGTSFTMTSRDLITYDDEYRYDNGNVESNVVSDTDDNVSVEGNELCVGIDKEMFVAPVLDIDTVKQISTQILQRANLLNGEVLRACANVAAFFMCTAPKEEPDQCSSKVLQLLSTSNQLEAEFYFYRAALHPTLFLESNISNDGQFTEIQSTALRNSLIGGAGRLESLREFKVFAVNLIYKLLRNNGCFSEIEPFSTSDHAILLHTVEIWSKSIGIGV